MDRRLRLRYATSSNQQPERKLYTISITIRNLIFNMVDIAYAEALC